MHMRRKRERKWTGNAYNGMVYTGGREGGREENHNACNVRSKTRNAASGKL
jgi:hypothetical protein